MNHCLFLSLIFISGVLAEPPHVIFILADDLGWNDVGFHGSNEIPTPNIDALAYTGVILNNYYVAPVCTPSRGSLMTGKYAIHLGLQHGVIHGSEPYGLSLSEVLLPQLLKKRDYSTHAVGKWHLGSFKKEYTPEYRGFDSHYGYWTGHQDYYDHTAQEMKGYWGYDMRRGMNTSLEDYGKYTTDLLTNEAIEVIKKHNTSRPLFLYLAHLATHSANPYKPLEAPCDRIAKFKYIENDNRRIFAAMVSKLDDSVGLVVRALSDKNMLNNTVIIFSTDNGGPAAGFNSNAASNWPLRGVKDTMWEGGVRGAALIWTSNLVKPRVSNQLMHISDWLPTLIEATGSKLTEEESNGIDGVSQWRALVTTGSSPRNEILLNIDDNRQVSGFIKKEWKLLKGNTWNGQWNKWYGPSGRERQYPWKDLFASVTGKVLRNITPLPRKLQIAKIREKSQFNCPPPTNQTDVEDIYLFNLISDPCEVENLAKQRPDLVARMEASLETFRKNSVPPRNRPSDPRSNPKFWSYAWTNWMDFPHYSVQQSIF